jgi:hypothetical protein
MASQQPKINSFLSWHTSSMAFATVAIFARIYGGAGLPRFLSAAGDVMTVAAHLVGADATKRR